MTVQVKVKSTVQRAVQSKVQVCQSIVNHIVFSAVQITLQGMINTTVQGM